MTKEGIDALYPVPSAIIKANGKSFVCIYTKVLTKAKAQANLLAGLDVVILFESTGTDFTGGYAQGVYDATEANNAVEAAGLSKAPVYFAIDTDTTDLHAVAVYLQGCSSVIGLGRTGVYGSYAVIGGVMATKTAHYFFQTYAWSGGLVDPDAHLFQYDNNVTIEGYAVDLDRTIKSDTDYGQYRGLASLAPAAPAQGGDPTISITRSGPMVESYEYINFSANANGANAVAAIANAAWGNPNGAGEVLKFTPRLAGNADNYRAGDVVSIPTTADAPIARGQRITPGALQPS